MQDKTPQLKQASHPEIVQADLPSEAHNAEQHDEDAQAQTLADEVLSRRPDLAVGASEQAPSRGDDSGGSPDLVDRMNQMVSSGRIDMSAFRGERNDDDEDGMLGARGLEDDFPGSAD